MVITSLVLDSTWRINGYTPDTQDIDYIRRLLPTIYHNDLDCYFWAFDIKLPSGRWLENIRFKDALKTINAYIETPEEA